MPDNVLIVTPPTEHTPLIVPTRYLAKSDVVVVVVYGVTVDYLRFVRQGDAFVPDGWR